jgi:sugar phosphate isomerase/epimerase
VIDAIETAAVLGSSNVLLAFFSRGDLRFRDDDGEFVNQSEGTFASYQLDEDKVTSVVNTLKQIMPRAQDAGVIVGLENTITARQSVEIIDRVGSEWLRVYYDVGNSTGNGYDVPGEIRMLENDMICEVHLKDWQTPILGSEDSQVDMAAAAAALRDIGYNKWLVLETSGREDNFLEDTRANVEFVNATFDMASAH